MKGWEYMCYKGSCKRWSKQLPDGRYVEVYYNTDLSEALVEPPVKWEYIVYDPNQRREDVVDTFPDTCTTLDEKLTYAYTVARMS